MMTRDDILKLAREVGAAQPADLYGRTDYIVMTFHEIERFATLLEAKVRKECAAICRKEAAETDKHLSIVIEALEDCAYLIENRGEK